MSKATTTVASDDPNALLRLWRNKEARSVIIQVFTLALLFAFLTFIINNAVHNLAQLGKTFSFTFMLEPAGYDINQRLIEYTSRDNHIRAMFVGILNTALVAGCGIMLATILGFIFGVLRLSKNWLINRFVYCFIEFTRNVPILLHILLIHGLIVHIMPVPRNAWDVGEAMFLTNRGVIIPKPLFENGFIWTGLASVAAVAFAWSFRRWAKKVQDATGKIYPVFLVSLAAIIGLPALVFFISGAPLSWEIPALKSFNFKGGLVMRSEFLALWLALSFYTSAYIAEIVRSGILAVHWGQSEAAYAIGIKPNRTLQLVVIPQALRVIIPPLTSQYLNLTKNSSLAIAIGYMDIVATIGGISLMQTGKEMESMIIVLSIYLSFSLVISSFMNWYNKKIKLVER
ncbi:MAG TPA: ABC transporter permease subunit [Rhodospirillales bacterium]|nr:ABC transporter permease subunit [Rhodospirillales bacterium]